MTWWLLAILLAVEVPWLGALFVGLVRVDRELRQLRRELGLDGQHAPPVDAIPPR